ncbi:MAG TPA: polyprenol phosphomannose-dependent alpha 1,6 mannosyltransferase MptB [Nocardioidaceae bacterium]|nr:polyprenol phosphomannose-dependent alpha 1,6 mannosyltransferase MptB [Nocardioidaceae bacterium]
MWWRGVVGSVLVLFGGVATSDPPASLLREVSGPLLAVGSTMPGRMLTLAVTVAGLGLVAWGWLDLLHRAADSGPAAVVRIALVRRATALWSLPLLLAPPLFSRDGWSYVAQGEMTRLGISPYVAGPVALDGPIVAAVDPMWMETPTPYGPLPLLWGALAAGVTGDPWLLVVAHRLLAGAGLVMLAYSVPRLATWCGRDPALASALVLPSPLMIAHGVGGLHNEVLMVGLMGCALVVAGERGWKVAAALGGLAAGVKLPGGLVCVGVVLVTLPLLVTGPARLVRVGGVAAVSLGTVWLAGAVVGVGVGWMGALGVPGVVETPLSATTQLGRLLGWMTAGLGASSGEVAVDVVRGLGVVSAVLVAGAACLRGPTGSRAAAVRTTGLVLLVVFLLGPVVHAWYALWWVPWAAASWRGPRWLSVLVSVSLLLGVTAPLDSSLDGAHAALALTAVLVAGVGGALLLASRRVPVAATPGRAAQPASVS